MNTFINEAIFKVCTTQFKKDAKEAHFTVENAGYYIYKSNGCYVVHNTKTNKSLRIRTDWCDYTVIVGFTYKTIKRKNIDKFDFVNALATVRTPVTEVEYHPTKDKYAKLKDRKWYVKNKKNDIAKTQKDIANLQARLIEETRYLVRYEDEVNKVRKELGLKTR